MGTFVFLLSVITAIAHICDALTVSLDHAGFLEARAVSSGSSSSIQVNRLSA